MREMRPSILLSILKALKNVPRLVQLFFLRTSCVRGLITGKITKNVLVLFLCLLEKLKLKSWVGQSAFSVRKNFA